MERHIDRQLTALTEGMQAALASAAALDAQSDGYGHLRGSHVANAVSLAKSSAALLFAAAKLHASFQHNITVIRKTEPAPSGFEAAATEAGEKEPEEEEEETVPLFRHEELETLGPEDIMREIPRRKARLAARLAACKGAREAKALDDEVRALDRHSAPA